MTYSNSTLHSRTPHSSLSQKFHLIMWVTSMEEAAHQLWSFVTYWCRSTGRRQWSRMGMEKRNCPWKHNDFLCTANGDEWKDLSSGRLYTYNSCHIFHGLKCYTHTHTHKHTHIRAHTHTHTHKHIHKHTQLLTHRTSTTTNRLWWTPGSLQFLRYFLV